MSKIIKLIKVCSKKASISCNECQADARTCLDYILRENFKPCEYCDTVIFDDKGQKIHKQYCQMCGRPLTLI